MYADLHLHTTASDGQFTPGEVVRLAREKGFAAIAITDHDNMGGLEEALTAGRELGVEVIPGVELSTFDEDFEIHILGYLIDMKEPRLLQMLKKFVDTREKRAIKMVEKLNEIGINISMGRVRELAGNDVIGRPHVARAMLEREYISSMEEAFSREYIGRGGRAYVERFKLRPCEAVELILQAGGVPVVAHPGYLRDGEALDLDKIEELIACGLRGIEAFHTNHTAKQEDFFREYAEREGLLVTGGSDCHGGKEILMGGIKLPYRYVEVLKEEAKKIKKRGKKGKDDRDRRKR